MSNRVTIVSDFMAALQARDVDKLKALADHLSDGIVMASPMGSASGKETIVSRLGQAPGGGGGGMAAGMMSKIVWGEPEEQGDKVSVNASLPPDLPLPIPIKGLTMAFTFEGELVSRIDVSPQM